MGHNKTQQATFFDSLEKKKKKISFLLDATDINFIYFFIRNFYNY